MYIPEGKYIRIVAQTKRHEETFSNVNPFMAGIEGDMDNSPQL